LKYLNLKRQPKKLNIGFAVQGIIAAELSDCILSDQLGHAPGINYRDALEDQDTYSQVLGIGANGLEIISTRNVFHNAGNGLEEVICPSCQFNAHDGNL
jgi:hypothetical protein